MRAEGQTVIGWRDVPLDRDMPMSPLVKDREPVIRQIFISRGADVMVPDALERKLYVIRKTASHKIQALKLKHGKEYFVPSMSTRTSSTKDCCWPIRWAGTTAICAIRVVSRDSAGAPTLFDEYVSVMGTRTSISINRT